MRGRKAQPTVLKILRGNPHDHKLNDREPMPEALDETCPATLIDPVAQREWQERIIPAIRRGQVTSADLAVAVAHCQLYATYLSQLVEANKHGHIVAVGPSKYPMPNPARQMAHKTWALLLKTDSDLGFTPSSRSRVQVQGSAARLQTATSLDRFKRGTRG